MHHCLAYYRQQHLPTLNHSPIRLPAIFTTCKHPQHSTRGHFLITYRHFLQNQLPASVSSSAYFTKLSSRAEMHRGALLHIARKLQNTSFQRRFSSVKFGQAFGQPSTNLVTIISDFFPGSATQSPQPRFIHGLPAGSNLETKIIFARLWRLLSEIQNSTEDVS